MKRIIEYKYGTSSYNIGDVVYLYRKGGKPTCRAKAVNDDNGSWTFKPLSKQSYYGTRDGLIPFGGKPYISAKEIEEGEEQS